ncbi:MAG: alpha/beta hydrolase [Candidatus Omnitrophota bacterium]
MVLFSRKRAYQKKLIPTPDVFWDSASDLFQHTDEREKNPTVEIYYATERQRVVSASKYLYNAKRDATLHLGKASVRIGPSDATWDAVARQSLKQKRKQHLLQIHIIGHSAGTRIVCAALNELRLVHTQQTEAWLKDNIKIGHVILMNGDFDRMVLKSYYRDHILDILRDVTFYVSRKDCVLKIARVFSKTPRLGECSSGDLSKDALSVLRGSSKVNIVDASSAKGSYKEGGHCYLLTSPYISSDMILLLKHHFDPSERHLKSKEEGLYWEFYKRRFDP